jgi:hypothetical protein
MKRRAGLLSLVGLVSGLVALAGVSSTPQSVASLWGGRPPLSQALANPDAFSPEHYTVGASEGPEKESSLLTDMESYWSTRVSYPTGHFQTSWVIEAAEQDRAVARGVPAGTVVYNPAQSQSPLVLDPNSFTSLGPAPLQSDGCLNCYNYGHVTGRVNAMLVDPSTPNVAYMAAVGGGVWKTTNCCSSATTWTSVTDDPLISTILVDALAIDPSNHNIVYAGTGDLNFGSFSMGSAGILKSTDAGTTWTVIGATVFAPNYPEPAGQFPQYQAVGKVAVDPRNGNNLIAGTKTGLYFSYDAGGNWTGPCVTNAYSTQRQDITGLLVRDTGSSTDLIAAVGTRGFSTTVQYDLGFNGANAIYRSTVPASGCPASWTLLTTAANGWPAGTGGGVPYYQGGDQLGRIDIAMAPSNPNVIYAQVQAIANTGGYQQGGQLGLWRTTDNGTTWSLRSGPSALGGCGGDYPQNWYDQGLAIDPNNPDLVIMDTYDIWKSTNGGTSFTDLTCGYGGGTTVHVDQHALAYVPGSSTTFLAGSDGGAYVTNDGGTSFSRLNDSLSTLEFYSGDITDNFANAASPGINGGMQDNGSAVYVWSGNPGPALWQLRKGGDGMFARIEPALGQRWYQESQNGSLAVSQTGPYGGQTTITGGWSGDSRRSFVFPYEIYKYCTTGPCAHMIAGSYRVWESIAGGIPSSTWLVNSPDLTKNTLGNRSFINQLAYATSDQTVAIVGTNDGNVQYGYNLGQGVANSATWVNVTGGNTVLPNRPVLDVATDPLNPWIGYAALGGFDQNTPSTPGHVYQVTCATNCTTFTWLNKSGNLPNIPVDSIIANPNYPQQVFAGTDWGVYFTNDITVGSPTWLRFQNGLPNTMIWDMAIDRSNTTLALFTRGRGAYAWPLPAGAFQPPTPTSTVTGTPPTATPQPSNTPTATATTAVTPTPTGTPGCPQSSWQPGPTVVVARYAFQAAVAGNKAYQAGGQTANNTPQPAVESYDPGTNSWTSLAPLPVALGQVSVGASGSKVYVAGGWPGGTNVTNTLHIYDIPTNTWSLGAPMPTTPGTEAAAGATLNGKFYVMGGDDYNAALDTTYIYDIATNTWTTGAALPAARTNTYATAFNNKIYLFGGADSSFSAVDTLFAYDPATNTWSNLGSANTGGKGNYGAISPYGTGQLLVTDGALSNFTPNNTTHIYDIAANAWTVGPTMSVAHAGHAQVTLPDGRVLVVSGLSGSGAVTTNSELLAPAPPCGTPTPTVTPVPPTYKLYLPAHFYNATAP